LKWPNLESGDNIDSDNIDDGDNIDKIKSLLHFGNYVYDVRTKKKQQNKLNTTEFWTAKNRLRW
jgi:hypothetical protein